MKVVNFGNLVRSILVSLSIFLLCGGLATAATVVLNPIEDTFIDEWGPNNVNGASSWLLARRGGSGYRLSTLVKFDLNSVPEYATVTSATLKLYYNHYADGDPSGKQLHAYSITEYWSEAATKWNNRPSYDPSSLDYVIMPSAAEVWLEWDLTDAVQDLVYGTETNCGWEIVDMSSSGGYSMIYFPSKESGGSIPQLDIEYTVPDISYWKPPYDNYAPNTPGGMPDFSTKQNGWKSIFPGPNGTIESTPSGDDVLNSADNRIGPGADCNLETTPSGDDYSDWSFSGPAAIANCFWWFDSKYGNPEGYPDDGEDQYALVERVKVVDQQETDWRFDYESFPLTQYMPGHLQEFMPTVTTLDAVQILLVTDSLYVETVEISIYDTYPSDGSVTPMTGAVITADIRASEKNVKQWFQFHFDSPVTLIPGNMYYLAARNTTPSINSRYEWMYDQTSGYPGGEGWACMAEYLLFNYGFDFDFKTEYYAPGVTDDHSTANVPYLIETLAQRMQTCSKGITDADDMQDAIDEWILEKGLYGYLVENTYDAPTFEFIEGEIERSQDVILQLGLYSPKLIDQQEVEWINITDNFPLTPYNPGHVQEFYPTVPVLDAVQILLYTDTLVPETIDIAIYDTIPVNASVQPIPGATTSMTIMAREKEVPEWFQFHFNPPVQLTPSNLYYIAVSVSSGFSEYEWMYHMSSGPPAGEGWACMGEYVLLNYGLDFDYKTEYFESDECTNRNQRYVTCAGVNSDADLIAVSDPYQDVMNPSADDHNDAQYVSHDLYHAEIGTPCPSLSYEWWLPGYKSSYKYAVVEKAVVICPAECDCEPGQTNGDALINLTDILNLIAYVYVEPYVPVPEPYAVCSGDPTCDCIVNLADILHLISHVYVEPLGEPANCTCEEWRTACGVPLRK